MKNTFHADGIVTVLTAFLYKITIFLVILFALAFFKACYQRGSENVFELGGAWIISIFVNAYIVETVRVFRQGVYPKARFTKKIIIENIERSRTEKRNTENDSITYCYVFMVKHPVTQRDFVVEVDFEAYTKVENGGLVLLKYNPNNPFMLALSVISTNPE